MDGKGDELPKTKPKSLSPSWLILCAVRPCEISSVYGLLGLYKPSVLLPACAVGEIKAEYAVGSKRSCVLPKLRVVHRAQNKLTASNEGRISLGIPLEQIPLVN